MEDQLGCDFYFGENIKSSIKKLDYSRFKKNIRDLKTIYFFNFYWIKGSVNLLFKTYDIYICTGEPYCLSTWLLLVLNKLMSKRIYFWTHGWYGRESRIKKYLKKIFFGLSSGIFLYGNYANKLMIQNGFDPKKLFVIYNSLSYDEQIVIRDIILACENPYKSYFENENKNLIFVGRLTKAKKIDFVIQALAILKERGRLLNMIFIGDGFVKDELKILVSHLNISDQVWFYGASYDEMELAKYLYWADLCVSPGNVGLTAIHSMTYGTPVLTHNNFEDQGPEFEAIIPGLSGDFFEYNDIHSLVTHIDNWFKNTLSREIIRKNCFDVVDAKYNPYYQIAVFKQIFSQLDYDNFR